MRSRAQSGTEFLTNYGAMILIVAVALVIILLISGAALNTIPASCSIYGTLRCADVAFGGNGISGSKLVVLATVAVPGVVNVISFNAIVGDPYGANGYCSTNGVPGGPTSASQGQQLVCEATFPFNAVLAETYSGSFSINGNYCPPATTGSSCLQASTYQFTGVWKGKGVYNAIASVTITSTTTTITSLTTSTTSSTTSSSTTSSTTTSSTTTSTTTSTSTSTTSTTTTSSFLTTSIIPLCYQTTNSPLQQGSVLFKVTDTQTLPTPKPFQQMLTFNPSSYATFEAPDLGNIRFYNGIATTVNELYSWCEANCSSSDTNTIFWLKLPNGASNGVVTSNSLTVNMIFGTSVSSNYVYDANYAGQAPQFGQKVVYGSAVGYNTASVQNAVGAHTVNAVPGSGSNVYLCAAAVDGGAYTQNVLTNANTLTRGYIDDTPSSEVESAIWHQYTNGCYDSSNSMIVAVGAGVNSASPYQIYSYPTLVAGSVVNTVNTGWKLTLVGHGESVTYNVVTSTSSVAIVVACGYGACDKNGGSITVPGSCSQQKLIDGDGYETAAIYTCSSAPGLYTVTAISANSVLPNFGSSIKIAAYVFANQIITNYGKNDNGQKIFVYYNPAPASTAGWSVNGIAGQTANAPTGSYFGTTNALYAYGNATYNRCVPYSFGSGYCTPYYLNTSIPGVNAITTNVIMTFDTYTLSFGGVSFLTDQYGFGQIATFSALPGPSGESYYGALSGLTQSYGRNPIGGYYEGPLPYSGLNNVNKSYWYKYDILVNGTGDDATAYIGPPNATIAALGTPTDTVPISSPYFSSNGNQIALIGGAGYQGTTGYNYTFWNSFVFRAYPPNGVMPSVSCVSTTTTTSSTTTTTTTIVGTSTSTTTTTTSSTSSSSTSSTSSSSSSTSSQTTSSISTISSTFSTTSTSTSTIGSTCCYSTDNGCSQTGNTSSTGPCPGPPGCTGSPWCPVGPPPGPTGNCTYYTCTYSCSTTSGNNGGPGCGSVNCATGTSYYNYSESCGGSSGSGGGACQNPCVGGSWPVGGVNLPSWGLQTWCCEASATVTGAYSACAFPASGSDLCWTGGPNFNASDSPFLGDCGGDPSSGAFTCNPAPDNYFCGNVANGTCPNCPVGSIGAC